MVATMTKIGPAVLNGGTSTLLAFSLLYTSKSYVFLSFFKIFFLICLFGLFHGLFALPVLLSLIGPTPNSKQVLPPSPSSYSSYSSSSSSSCSSSYSSSLVQVYSEEVELEERREELLPTPGERGGTPSWKEAPSS